MSKAAELAEFGSGISSGPNAVEGLAKAWINFNGAGTIATRDSFNAASIADNGTGQYTVTYSSAMGNTSYMTLASSGCNRNGNSYTSWCAADTTSSGTGDTDAYTNKTSSALQICNLTGANTADDTIDINLLVQGDLA
tara:strand:- start:96 stop:509 length:414 start_codon:yes stop_codon:yes gene_type:complete